jgi:hypothetical protein
MRDVHPDLPVHEIGVGDHDLPVDGSWSGEPGPVFDRPKLGGPPRVSGLLALGAAGVATVASIVLVSNHSDDHRTAIPTRPSVATTLPSPRPPVPISAGPAVPASALVEGQTTCFGTDSGPDGVISFGIRNRLSRAVVVSGVAFVPQRGVAVAATSIGVNHRSPSTCPEPKDLHPAAHYQLAPGSVWISVRLTRMPACGTELRSAWVVSFTDRGQRHQVRFSGAGITPDCPPRSHSSHDRHR